MRFQSGLNWLKSKNLAIVIIWSISALSNVAELEQAVKHMAKIFRFSRQTNCRKKLVRKFSKSLGEGANPFGEKFPLEMLSQLAREDRKRSPNFGNEFKRLTVEQNLVLDQENHGESVLNCNYFWSSKSFLFDMFSFQRHA